MRKEIYETLCSRLEQLHVTPDGFYGVVEPGVEVPDGWDRAIKHIDLWNHNVEFIEQEEQWDRPAVFIEFAPIDWKQPVKIPGDYRGDCIVHLHVVTDWHGSSAAGSDFKSKSLEVFDLLDSLLFVLDGLTGESFSRFHLISSRTNHNHDELLENIESYQCVLSRKV